MSGHEQFATALYERTRAYSDALDRLVGAAGDEEDRHALREAIELVRCLRRLIPSGITVQQIRGAFGAPGDFGYGTPLGNALAALYRQPSDPAQGKA